MSSGILNVFLSDMIRGSSDSCEVSLQRASTEKSAQRTTTPLSWRYCRDTEGRSMCCVREAFLMRPSLHLTFLMMRSLALFQWYFPCPAGWSRYTSTWTSLSLTSMEPSTVERLDGRSASFLSSPVGDPSDMSSQNCRSIVPVVRWNES